MSDQTWVGTTSELESGVPGEKLVPIPGVYGGYRYSPEQSLILTSAGYLIDATDVPAQEPVLSFSLPFEKLNPYVCEPDKLILSRPMRLDLELRRQDSAYWEMELWADEERTIPIDIRTLFPQFAGKPLWIAIQGQIRPNYGNVVWATMTGDLILKDPPPVQENPPAPQIPPHEIWLDLTAEESNKIPITATEAVWDVQTVQYEMMTLTEWYALDNTELPPEFPPSSTDEGPWLIPQPPDTQGEDIVLVGRPGVRTLVGGDVTITKDVTRVGISA